MKTADGLGSIRHATDLAGEVISYHEFDPYGNSLTDGGSPYGYTGEWWSVGGIVWYTFVTTNTWRVS